MNPPVVKVSVLMPVYNSEKYLHEAIESILNQTFQDFEFLIIDDASTDKSIEIIRSYADARITLIQKPVNTGYTESLNLGIGISKGEYIARMDSDDISLPTRLEKQIVFMQQNPSIILSGTNFEVLPTKEIVITPSNHEDIKVGLLNQSCIAHPTVMLRKKALSDNDIRYDTADEPAEDYNLWVRLCKIGLLANLDEVLLRYRVHPDQTSHVQKALQEENANKARIKGIEQLIPNLSEKDAHIHLALMKTQPGPVEQLENVCKWSEYIIKENNEKKVFDRLKLDWLMKSKKRNCIRGFFFYRDSNFDTLKLLYDPNEKYYQYFSFVEQLKIVIKCVFRYKPQC
ncbi:MAG TPA: glycosyltransferase [Mucilaginibacter sp.]|jgi:glycosyltransferase involved in cell wall biosynthesis|nr:glycosyltransferase [Mucilaginibacter sp.]